jgi:hypothetical protein
MKSSKLANTRKMVKKWLFFEGLEKEAQNGCFLPVFDLIEKSRFFDSITSSTHQKMRL